MGEKLFENQELADWLEDGVKNIFQRDQESRIDAAAMIAVSEDGFRVVGYYQADAQIKALLAHHIYIDAVLDEILANPRKIRQALDELEEEEDG